MVKERAVMDIRFPLGIDSFSEVRDGDYYYVDKTEMIRELLNKGFQANLVTRPRRFGKTLTMSMLEDFLDIRRDSSAHFAGLQVTEDEGFCRVWMNQWPVLFLTFKDVDGRNFPLAYERLEILLSDFCVKNSYLAQSDLVNMEDQKGFQRLLEKRASEAELGNSLFLLTRLMCSYYGKPVVLLLDEYDVPLAKASEFGYYTQMLDLIRALMGKALKTNEFLKLAVVTGCLRIAKESIFTGTNHFVTDAITGDRFNEYLGFTETEVRKLLVDAGLAGHEEEMKRWYDGYCFGEIDVYCPWDVLNHASALQGNSERKPKNYWGSTSHNNIIYQFISREELDVNQKLEALLAGACIWEEITDELTYDTLHSTEKNLWSLLYLTGYLTLAKEEQSYENKLALRIPNEEVKSIFKTAIVEWFYASVQTKDRGELFGALWSGNTDRAAVLISDILFETISYHDYAESYYHAFIAGIFAGAGYVVESNAEYGTGRPDVVVKDRKNRRAIVMEMKRAPCMEKMSAACDCAVEQIRERKYCRGIEHGYRDVTAYGIAFYGKECMMKILEE
ncbi:MAG: ATP-binding protein [Blautia sp.]|nr:ATP-binding protein [Blautia sp.]